jgi:hypothetical protein
MLNIVVMDGRDIGQADIICRNEHGPGSDLGFERSGRTKCNNPVDTADGKCCQVRPVIDPVGREPVLVSHEHYDVAGKNLSRAKGRAYPVFFEGGERGEQEARSADDTQHFSPSPCLKVPVCQIPFVVCPAYNSSTVRMIVSVITNI